MTCASKKDTAQETIREMLAKDPYEEIDRLRVAIEDIQIVAQSYGSKSEILHAADGPQYRAAALDTIYNMATEALRGK